jgi:hypothetical protein
MVVLQKNRFLSKDVNKEKKKTTYDANLKYDFQVEKTYDNDDYLCYICEKSFDYLFDLREHDNLVHQTNKGKRIFTI